MAKKNDIKESIKNNPLQAMGLAFTIIVTLANVVIGYFLLTIATRLAPVQQDIAVLAQEIQANNQKDATEHPTFVTKDTFATMQDEINHISNRVDTIYSIIAKK